jgi:hypothetical protein
VLQRDADWKWCSGLDIHGVHIDFNANEASFYTCVSTTSENATCISEEQIQVYYPPIPSYQEPKGTSAQTWIDSFNSVATFNCFVQKDTNTAVTIVPSISGSIVYLCLLSLFLLPLLVGFLAMICIDS